ncbi:MAG: DUF6122 family protein [Proteobacteria bacterium]|nr:DUF6122 family protein [Pseudomonadota bacterium]
MMFRAFIHIFLHVAIPGMVAWVSFRNILMRAWLVMLATTLIDLDHLLADPIYDATRCSIGFHPLHQYPIIVFYALLALWPKTRLIGVGLVIHMILDGIDCLWMQYD